MSWWAAGEKALKEVLEAHELVKIRFQAEKEYRREISQDLAEKSGALLVRITGNTAVFYRQAVDPDKREINLPR